MLGGAFALAEKSLGSEHPGTLNSLRALAESISRAIGRKRRWRSSKRVASGLASR